MNLLIACVEIKMMIQNHDSSHFSLDWELGSCYGPKSRDHSGYEYYNNDKISNPTFIDRCCLPSGRHVLICHNRMGPFGWGESSIEILGHRYCDDFVGFKTLRKLELSGNNTLYAKHQTNWKRPTEYLSFVFYLSFNSIYKYFYAIN